MQVLNIFHVLIAIAMVALVLVQRGAGATAGAAFGSGASGTVFGSRGAGTFLTKSTWILATLFCAISLTMAVVVSRSASSPEPDLGVVSSARSVEQDAVAPAVEERSLPGADSAQPDLPVLDTGASDQAIGTDLPEPESGGSAAPGADTAAGVPEGEPDGS